MTAGPGNSARRPAPAAPWLTAGVLAVAAVAWVAMAWLHAPEALPPVAQDHAAHHYHDHGLRHAPGTGVAAHGMLLWLGGWTLMVVAMMMPPALPFLQVMARLVAGRVAVKRLILASAAGFLLVWMVAGLLLLVAGAMLSAVIGAMPVVAERPFLPAGAATLLAAGYQFTPLKKACLAACRSPAGMAMTRWRAETPFSAATAIGLRYGAVCVGCCWATMLLGLVVGAFALPVMVITAVIMAAERMLPSVRPLIPLQAVLAASVGGLMVSGMVPPAFAWP